MYTVEHLENIHLLHCSCGCRTWSCFSNSLTSLFLRACYACLERLLLQVHVNIRSSLYNTHLVIKFKNTTIPHNTYTNMDSRFSRHANPERQLIHRPSRGQCPSFVHPFEKRSYYTVAMSDRPPVRPSEFSGLFQHAFRCQFETWCIHSVNGTTCRVWVSL